MASTAAQLDPRLIAIVLPSIPESVRIARFHIRATLSFHGLDKYADNAEIVTSELVTNAIQHVRGDGTDTVGIILLRARNPEAVTIIVTDSSPEGPALRETPAGNERGRGLQIIEALSDHWGWHPEDGGKAVFAVLANEADA